MAYTPFESDLFVSYGHLDNDTDSDDQQWVDRFHRDLQKRLSQYLGEKVDIWRDNRLQGNDAFPKEIEDRLRRVAAMVSIVSPRYLSSDWCQRELQRFIETTQANAGRAGVKSRLFKVIKMPVDLKAQPEVMQDLLGYEFYRTDDRGRPRELPDRDPNPGAEEAYRARLDDVAYDLHSLLKELRRGAAAPATPATPSKTIYLAETTADLGESRDQFRRELIARGYRVLPEHQLSWRASDLIKAVSGDLEVSCLSLHLVGGISAFVPEGASRSVDRIQYELAKERQTRGGFRCLLWMPAGLEGKDDRQTEFLQSLHEDLRTNGGAELLKTSIEALKSFVLDTLAAPPAQPKTLPADEPRRRIYLVCEPTDLEAVRPLQQSLARCGLGVDLPLTTGDQSEIRLDHEAALQDCDGVLIYHGSGSDAWLREKVRDLRRARGRGRSRPFIPQGIFLGPEPTGSKRGYENDEFVIISNFGEFAPDLKPFLDRIEDRKGISG
jgi:TIR domain